MNIYVILAIILLLSIFFLIKYPIAVISIIGVCIILVIAKLLQDREINELKYKKELISKADEKMAALDAKEKAVDAQIYEKQKRIQDLRNNYEDLDRKYKEAKEQKEIKLQSQLASLNEQIQLAQDNSFLKKYIKMKTLYESYRSATKNYIKNNETVLDEKFLEVLEPTVELQLNCMNVKQLKSLYTQNQKLISDCLARYEDRYTNKTNATIYKLMTIALEAELQNILHTINYGKLETAEHAVSYMTQKYYAIAVEGNQSIAPTMKKFIGEIEYLFLEAVKIEYEYFAQKERIKEEQRALREQMRQEAEERKQLEAQRKQVEKEESKYQTEMQNVQEQIRNSEDAEKIALLEARLAEIQAQLNNVEQKKEDIIKLQNGKAGYVYVISNLGSFGDNVFKVGMTRRLEPMDRVKELGDASVPFPFDVHSFIFSDDAVGLEHTLHVELNERRVNKVNLRKEFFRVSVDELEDLVYKHQPSAEFNRTMLAEQYNQSLSTDFVREELTEFEDE